MDDIRTVKNELDTRICALQAAVDQLQGACPHERVEKEYKASQGNYDPSADAYWINFNCLDCDKRWQEDQ